MYKTSIQEEILDGIELNIEVTKNQIYQLHLEFSTLGIGRERIERRLILQKLQVLEETLQLLKIRQVYASEMTLQ